MSKFNHFLSIALIAVALFIAVRGAFAIASVYDDLTRGELAYVLFGWVIAVGAVYALIRHYKAERDARR